ncbi:MAG: hypothetical protein COB02_15260 [Candidatus Cloacimonadota bacterium]|nr:MAG: hypothetical protein COB02_15260 [Candidatus Cloacimonadota bacterium]
MSSTDIVIKNNGTVIFNGFHGTCKKFFNLIKGRHFKICKNRLYLGIGTYFFIEGLQNPIELAKSWAIQTVEEETKLLKTPVKDWVVIEACIKSSSLLDLTTDEGSKVLARAEEELYNSLGEDELSKEVDRFAFTVLALQELKKDHDVIKSFLCIKTGIRKDKEKGKYFTSIIPNSTVITVTNPKKSIDKKTIKIKEEGKTL